MSKVLKGGRSTNEEVRPREYLTTEEVMSMIKAIRKSGRNRTRNAALIEVVYRHGLRVSEAINLRWKDVSIAEGTIQINRLKNGESSIHPLGPDEIRTLRQLHNKTTGSSWLFTAEGGGPMDRQTAYVVVRQAARLAKIPFPVHPHMLRHARGYKLVNAGTDIRKIAGFLGHKSLKTTMRYTQIDYRQYEGMADC